MAAPFDELYTKKELTKNDLSRIYSLTDILQSIGADAGYIETLKKISHNIMAEDLTRQRDARLEADYAERARALIYVD